MVGEFSELEEITNVIDRSYFSSRSGFVVARHRHGFRQLPLVKKNKKPVHYLLIRIPVKRSPVIRYYWYCDFYGVFLVGFWLYNIHNGRVVRTDTESFPV